MRPRWRGTPIRALRSAALLPGLPLGTPAHLQHPRSYRYGYHPNYRNYWKITAPITGPIAMIIATTVTTEDDDDHRRLESSLMLPPGRPPGPPRFFPFV